MNKQRLEQKNELSLSPQQIQFLNLLKTPLTELEKCIKEEIEENPALEEEEEEEVKEHEFNQRKENSTYNRDINSISNIPTTKDLTLQEHLHQQLISYDLSDSLHYLISYLINSLDDSGFLNRDNDSILNDLIINSGSEFTTKDLGKAINILKELEPKGVGAKNIKESIIIQLKNNSLAVEIIEKFYTQFTNKNFEYIIRHLNITEAELKNVYKHVESLNPIPSSGFSKNNNPIEYISPDFIVEIKDGQPIIKLNKTYFKPIKLSPYYSKLLQETNDKETAVFLKEKIDKAKWFKDSLLKREVTLKNVMSTIISFQEEYFISGDEKKLKPMKLADIAEKVKMDISTISRVSNSKYIETYFSTFKVKELFSESYKKENGEIVSTKEIKQILKDLIEQENKKHPLNDEELSLLLEKEGFDVARRTVAKYRDGLGIKISKLRREL
tara:strand:- start:379 stop:1704 length:1326 start_codon:yes stop_codon:yes gene_type:complete